MEKTIIITLGIKTKKYDTIQHSFNVYIKYILNTLKEYIVKYSLSRNNIVDNIFGIQITFDNIDLITIQNTIMALTEIFLFQQCEYKILSIKVQNNLSLNNKSKYIKLKSKKRTITILNKSN